MDLLRKLQVRPGTVVVVAAVPDEVRTEVRTWAEDPAVERLIWVDGLDIAGAAVDPTALGSQNRALVLFVRAAAEVAAAAAAATAWTGPDGLLWCCYPKKSSKRYRTDVTRDSACWDALGQHGFEPVRQVAIDADWSALRFRPAERIATMRRDPAAARSAAGRTKAAQMRRS